MRALVCLAVALAAGCFNPDFSGVVFTCSTSEPFCPPDFTCSSGYCVAMEISGPGCSSGSGTLIGNGVYACTGPFNALSGSSPHAIDLCAAPLHPCTNSTGIDLAKCQTLPGFFAASVPARQDDSAPYAVSCGVRNPASQHSLIGGCGGKAQLTPLPQPCSGFTLALDCRADAAWTCNGASSVDILTNTSASDGVLCCP